MKATAAILFLIITSGNLLYYIWYEVKMHEIKGEMRQTIALFDTADQPDLLRVPVSDLEKDEADEVWYKGKLFDVVKRETEPGNTTFVFILEDQKEENILAVVRDLFTGDSGNSLHRTNFFNSVKASHNLFNLQYIIRTASGFNVAMKLSTKIAAPLLLAIPFSFHEVQTPPPKF